MFRRADWSLPTFRDNLSGPIFKGPAVQESKKKKCYFVQIILLFLERALLGKLIVPQLVKELPASYGTQDSPHR